MKQEEDAVQLAELMVETGERMGTKTVALITDMNQPLGYAVGNAVELEEVVSALRGMAPADLLQLCLELAGHMLHLGERAASLNEGKKIAQEMIDSGKALEKFREMVRAQGGDETVIDHPDRLPKAMHKCDVPSPATGFVRAIQCEQIGNACVILGGGRERKDDLVDPSVGIILHKKVGDHVAAGEPLCKILYNSGERGERARIMVEQSYQIGDDPPKPRPLVHRVISSARLN